jgi:hypothetical protein
LVDPRERVDVLRLAPVDLARAVVLVRFAQVPEDLARVVPDFLAPLPLVERLLVDPLALRALEPRDDAPREEEPDDEAAPSSSSLHLPDITRCAASATASAISEPSLVALAIMLLAAWLAVSAASSPASRIARRALGLALLAAAAAASPAASISLLIAALASLSTVVWSFDVAFEELEEPEDPEEPLRADLAMASSPVVARKDTLGP